MTHAELVTIARRGGLVQWLMSKKIERLRLAANGSVMATRPLTMTEHFINPRPEHWCVEVDPKDSFPVWQILW